MNEFSTPDNYFKIPIDSVGDLLMTNGLTLSFALSVFGGQESKT